MRTNGIVIRPTKPKTKIRCLPIQKNMGWCDDPNSKFYNKLIKIKKNLKISHENYTVKICLLYTSDAADE